MEILTKEEFKILGVFRKDIHKKYTFKDIKKQTKKTSQHYIFNTLKKLADLNILKMERIGKTNLYEINLENPLTIDYLSFQEHLGALQAKLPHQNINELISSIKTPFFIFLVTGSYAISKQTAKSDLDVVVIVETNIKETEAALRKGELMIPEVHSYVFTRSQFLEMLLNKEANYGKLLYKRRLILFGAENYYAIVKEAIKNGFAG